MGLVTLPTDVDARRERFNLLKFRCESHLAYFIREAWHVVEPGTPYIDNWHIHMIAAHLEAITREEVVGEQVYNRLLINVPPGCMKSFLVAVFWCAWEWGPRNLPHMRYVCTSHNLENSIRDSGRTRKLLLSDWYQERWGDRVNLTTDNVFKLENSATGFRIAATASGITGKRGDRVILDDPNSWDSANSEQMRQTTNDWFLGALPSRMNHPKRSAIVCVMQRFNETDVSGTILDIVNKQAVEAGKPPIYDHIMLPMEFDPDRKCITKLGYQDIRTEEGELLFPDRFPDAYLENERRRPFEYAGQYQQAPTPKGGGLIKDEWWRVWTDNAYPPLDFVIAVADTAFTEKEENDPSAIIVFGVFSVAIKASVNISYAPYQKAERIYAETAPNVIMMYAWNGRLEFPELCSKAIKICKDNKVDLFLIEDKANGKSIAQELRKVFHITDFGIQLVEARGDKWNRLYAVQHLFTEGLDKDNKWIPGIVWAPTKQWAEDVIREVSTFPKGRHDDYVDCVAHGLRFLRDSGMLSRAPERLAEIEFSRMYHGPAPTPLYPS